MLDWHSCQKRYPLEIELLLLLSLLLLLNFNTHINRISSNANKSLGFIKRNIETKHKVSVTLYAHNSSTPPLCGAPIQVSGARYFSKAAL